MGGLGFYQPAMAMIGLQFHYAVLAMFTRAALLHGMNTRVFVVYRQAIATLALAPFALSCKRRESFKTSLGLRNLSLLFITSLIGVTANQNAYFEGLHLSSSTVTTAMSNLIPALTFVLATIFGLEKIDVRSLRSLAKIAGTVLCVGGAITMALLKGQKLLNMQFLPSKQAFGLQGDHWLLGCAFLLTSSITWSFWMIMQVPVSSSCPDHVLSTFWMCLMAAIEAAIFTLVVDKDSQAWNLNSTLEYSSCLYAGIGIAVSVFIQSWTISKRGPLFCAMFNPLCTVITAMVAATFLHEELYVGSLIGALAVISGLYIVLWGKAEEVEGIKQEAQLNSTDQNDQINCKTDLEEALLSHVSESKIIP
ncbi:WAT1-related protein At4g30420-like isoform X2 [Prosopis cineraria]|uniref:WAT1-related protein At4g30420-like isoform X2 n=1 Tax=Prosopis cineraria TaxID=364024 RepID=UPI00240F3C06|nr:WAT1-related protein At4g30420-like isoform X2 [Prosopis cineraria]